MSTEWFYTTNKQQMGPVSWNELRELAESGILKPHDLVWTEGMDEWVKAVNQRGLFADSDVEEQVTAKKSSQSIAKPPPGRRTRSRDEEEEADEEDDKEAKRTARKKQQDRAQMAVGVKVGLILAGVFAFLLLLGCAGGLLVWMSVGPSAPPTGLENTTWVGSENLQGFGRLEFRFHRGGSVTMVDAAGQTAGNYTLQGNTITMRFDRGRVTYTGTRNGNTIRGTGRNVANAVWNFNVNRN